MRSYYTFILMLVLTLGSSLPSWCAQPSKETMTAKEAFALGLKDREAARLQRDRNRHQLLRATQMKARSRKATETKAAPSPVVPLFIPGLARSGTYRIVLFPTYPTRCERMPTAQEIAMEIAWAQHLQDIVDNAR